MNPKHQKHFERIIERCDERIANTERAIAKFCDELKENPARAFQWADGKMETAAEGKVAEIIKEAALAAIKNHKTREDLEAMVNHQAMNAGKYMKRSTSQSANYIENAEACAWIRALDKFDGLVNGAN